MFWIPIGDTLPKVCLEKCLYTGDDSTCSPSEKNIRQRSKTNAERQACKGPWFHHSCDSSTPSIIHTVFRYASILDRVRDGNHLHGAAYRIRARSPEEVQLQIHQGSRVQVHKWVRLHTCVDGSKTRKYHAGQNDYRYRSEIKSKTIGLYQITDVTDLY